MKNKLLFTFLLLGLSISVLSQTSVEDFYKKIDLKLKKDKRYLNLFYYDFSADNNLVALVPSIPRINGRESFTWEIKDNVQYRIVFLKEGIGIDSLILLYIDKITDLTAGGEGLFQEGGGPNIDTQRVVYFMDMHSLKQNEKSTYDKLFKFTKDKIGQLEDSPPSSLLGINPDEEVKTSLGISSRDNTDFLNFMRANHIHWYPRPKVVKQARRGQKVEEKTSYKIDASLMRWSFSHEIMEFAGLAGSAFDWNTMSRVVPVLPWKSMAFSGAFRTLIQVSEKKVDIAQALVIDARLHARIGLNSTSVANLPFVQGGKPRLVFGSGGGVDLSFTRPWGLPFINIYILAGSTGFTDPPDDVKLASKTAGAKDAYFTFNEAEFTYSFYWNTSDKLNARFRFDIGVGYYDVWRATYTGTNKTPSKKETVQDNMYPVLNMHFNFSPENNEFYGGSFRLFDSFATLSAWLKVMEFDGGHVIRFEGQVISPPIARKQREWETAGGAIVQLRYRYGL